MCARRSAAAGVALAALAFTGLAAYASDPGSTRNRAAYADTFPAGPARGIAERACRHCHSPMLVTQQAKDSAGWERTLGTMVAWGSPLTPDERDSLRTYLLANFGVRKAAKRR